MISLCEPVIQCHCSRLEGGHGTSSVFSGGVRPAIRALFLFIRCALLIHRPQNLGAYYIWRMQYMYPLKSVYYVHFFPGGRYRAPSESAESICPTGCPLLSYKKAGRRREAMGYRPRTTSIERSSAPGHLRLIAHRDPGVPVLRIPQHDGALALVSGG